MPKQISINIGFVTNSSSVVYHFSNELLQHPKVSAFLKAFEIEGGFVGEDLWHRSECATVAITKEQKQAVVAQLARMDSGPSIAVDTDEFVVIYGDEYQSIASALMDVIGQALVEEKGGTQWDLIGRGQDYN